MAITLPDAPGLRHRLSRLWSRLARIGRWRPSFSMAAVRAAARTSTTMPLGAQQLKRQRTSTLLSLGGVTASLLVIFAQLGIDGEKRLMSPGGRPQAIVKDGQVVTDLLA